jgi:hypothetical protein
MYYVAVGWEYYYKRPTTSATGHPIVPNVVNVNCKWHSSTLTTNQLFKFYDAYYKKSRGSTLLLIISIFNDNFCTSIKHKEN